MSTDTESDDDQEEDTRNRVDNPAVINGKYVHGATKIVLGPPGKRGIKRKASDHGDAPPMKIRWLDY
jgi:hypothetical protein